MKKQLMFGFVLGTLAISGGISPLLTQNSSINANRDDAVAPTVVVSDDGWQSENNNGKALSITAEVSAGDYKLADLSANSTITYGRDKTDLTASYSDITTDDDDLADGTYMVQAKISGLSVATTYSSVQLNLSDGTDDLDTVNLPDFTAGQTSFTTNGWTTTEDSVSTTASVNFWGLDSDGTTVLTEDDFSGKDSSITYGTGTKKTDFDNVTITSDTANEYVITISGLNEDTNYTSIKANLVFKNITNITYSYDLTDFATDKGGLGSGAIAGIVIASLIVVGLLAYGGYYLFGNKEEKVEETSTDSKDKKE